LGDLGAVLIVEHAVGVDVGVDAVGLREGHAFVGGAICFAKSMTVNKPSLSTSPRERAAAGDEKRPPASSRRKGSPYREEGRRIT
jgi:hypothetical protein